MRNKCHVSFEGSFDCNRFGNHGRMVDVTPKRSIIYDEIGERLGQGRKYAGGTRTEVRSPAGVSRRTKKLALERAKAAVINRHFHEVVTLFNDEIEFLKALDEWGSKDRPDGFKISERGSDAVLQATKRYYEEYELNKPDVRPEDAHQGQDGSVEVPIFLPSGRQRPRPKKKVG